MELAVGSWNFQPYSWPPHLMVMLADTCTPLPPGALGVFSCMLTPSCGKRAGWQEREEARCKPTGADAPRWVPG